MSLPRHEPRRPTFSEETFRRLLAPLVRRLAAAGVGPNTLTAAGWALALCSALLFGAGQVSIAGAVMLVAGLFDALDGAVARESGRMSDFGAFLDSTLDRLSEAATFAGITFFYATSGRPIEALAAVAALTFSLLTSYARARAEGLGYECKVGLLERPARVVLLSLAAILGLLTLGVWLVAAGALVTAVQRILHVYRASRK